ncbi:MRPL39 family protein [Megaselia abdita]
MSIAKSLTGLHSRLLARTGYQQIRNLSHAEAVSKRNTLFNEEQNRQKENVGRIEKIEVRYLGLPDDVTLVMNKGISTPFNCAQHLTEDHCKRSVLALLDGKLSWDIHRPLQESCTLQLLNFHDSDTNLVNKAFWRTCTFMLGAALEEAFTEKAGLKLHSFPGPNIRSGSFAHDIVLGRQGWQANTVELRALSAEMTKLSAKELKIERLDIKENLAVEMFSDNPYKKQQIPDIANTSENSRVTVYRVGNHIDISRGPMVSNTRFLGKCTISAIHEVAKEDNLGIYRVQGVALPTGTILNHFAYSILEDRSRKLNPARLPTEPFEEQTMLA